MPARPRTYLANKGLSAKRARLWQMPGEKLRHKTPPPVYRSWSHFLAKTTHAERMKPCRMKAKKANAERLLSEAPEIRVTAQEVWAIQEASEGQCFHCGSLAVEPRPSNPKTGAPLPWAQIGRRIGSLQHLTSRFGRGGNDAGNLVWSCLWCNDHERERRWLAVDYGGHYPRRRRVTEAHHKKRLLKAIIAAREATIQLQWPNLDEGALEFLEEDGMTETKWRCLSLQKRRELFEDAYETAYDWEDPMVYEPGYPDF